LEGVELAFKTFSFMTPLEEQPPQKYYFTPHLHSFELKLIKNEK